jgi:hypothetical protein
VSSLQAALQNILATLFIKAVLINRRFYAPDSPDLASIIGLTTINHRGNEKEWKLPVGNSGFSVNRGCRCAAVPADWLSDLMRHADDG